MHCCAEGLALQCLSLLAKRCMQTREYVLWNGGLAAAWDGSAEVQHVTLFLGSCPGEEEKESSIHCLHACQVPLVTRILLCYTTIMFNFWLPAERALQGYTPCETQTGSFEVRSNIVCNFGVTLDSLVVMYVLHVCNADIHNSQQKIYTK